MNTPSADQELLIRDKNGKEFTDNNTNSNTLEDNFENSDLDVASNLSSSTEIDTAEKESIRRLKRLTKIIPIIRYNNPFCHDYRKLKRLNSGKTPIQPIAQPEGKEDDL